MLKTCYLRLRNLKFKPYMLNKNIKLLFWRAKFNYLYTVETNKRNSKRYPKGFVN
jgi:hypothetical protein